MRRGLDPERGTALIAALLLVALMAAVAVQLIDLTRFAAFRTSQIDQRQQAYWYARGAVALGESALRGLDPGRDVIRSDEPWLSGATVLPITDGLISGQVLDGNNCLNLNALVPVTSADDPGESDQLRDAADAVRSSFMVLSSELGVAPGQAENLLAQMIDWIDPDRQVEPGGAEDRVYAAFSPPYRAANQRFTELEELRALPDMTPALYQVYEPFLCVRPTREQPPLNINTLTLDQAVLLLAVLEGELDLGDAESVLFRRPPAGYDTAEAIWTDPVLSRLELNADQQKRLALRSQWYDMEVHVQLADTRFYLRSVVEMTEGGDIRRHSQRFGAF